mmetsp:Transcript_16953/g.41998  ORF Transcript_16953/g.41998 Transcript_16953/m.41998 type:complete len:304 (-) Transcript_16953:2219-3130(-)
MDEAAVARSGVRSCWTRRRCVDEGAAAARAWGRRAGVPKPAAPNFGRHRVGRTRCGPADAAGVRVASGAGRPPRRILSCAGVAAGAGLSAAACRLRREAGAVASVRQRAVRYRGRGKNDAGRGRGKRIRAGRPAVQGGVLRLVPGRGAPRASHGNGPRKARKNTFGRLVRFSFRRADDRLAQLVFEQGGSGDRQFRASVRLSRCGAFRPRLLRLARNAGCALARRVAKLSRESGREAGEGPDRHLCHVVRVLGEGCVRDCALFSARQQELSAVLRPARVLEQGRTAIRGGATVLFSVRGERSG